MLRRRPAPGRGEVLTEQPVRRDAAYPDPRLLPWPGFALAATAAVEHLEELSDLDLWLVTTVRDGMQTVVAAAGAWSSAAPPGLSHPWQDSFCMRMVERRGPVVAPDIAAVPAYAELAVGPLAAVRAYVGVPLEGEDGVVFGTLCGFAGERKDVAWDGAVGSVRLVGRMLSTILAREQFARARSQEAADAYALVERDPATGLRNRRGWDASVEQEDTRCQRYGSTASVLALDLGRAGPADRIARCAEVLASSCRPGDVLARLGIAEFAVLALECDLVAARALHARLRVQLRTAGLAAATAVATRRPGERLADAWARAGEEVSRELRRRPRR
jgi:GGDEF domain-containing protein